MASISVNMRGRSTQRRPRLRRGVTWAGVARVLTSTALASTALATSLSAQSLPPADDVIESYVRAIGGAEAHTSPRSIRTTGIIELPGMGLQGTFEVLQLLPDRSVTRVSIPGIGEIESGFDGSSGWSVDPLMGAALMEGDELGQARDRANILGTLRDPAVVPVRETLELGGSDGERCWRVRLAWASGGESVDCYSTETGLLIASENTEVSPMGEMLVTTRFSDYEAFGPMILPTRLVQSAMGQVQELIVQDVVVDDVDATELTPPPAIQTLLGGSPPP